MEGNRYVYLVEEFLFFKQYRFHKQKIAFHRSSMRCYQDFLMSNKVKVKYIEAHTRQADVRELIAVLHKQGVRVIHFVDPSDDWLDKRIRKASNLLGIKLIQYESPLFINTREQLAEYFTESRKRFFQTKFYIDQRKRFQVLLDERGTPCGGKWTFDKENRKRYPKGKSVPEVNFPKNTPYFQEARNYVKTHFNNNPGHLGSTPLYPYNYQTALTWLDQFLERRFAEFGHYEDAIKAHEHILNHSVLSPVLNVGLLEIRYVLDRVLDYSEKQQVPLNSTEGFVRQILGWREFLRGVYRAFDGTW